MTERERESCSVGDFCCRRCDCSLCQWISQRGGTFYTILLCHCHWCPCFENLWDKRVFFTAIYLESMVLLS